MIGNTDKDSDLKSIIDRFNITLPKVRKLLSSTSVLALLLPNIMSIGVVAAQDTTPDNDEPAIEEVTDFTEDTQETTTPQTPTIPDNSNPDATQQDETSTEPIEEETTEDSLTTAQIIEDEFYPIGFEVRGLDGTRTDDVTIWVQDENFTVYSGSFNEYGQWYSDEALPVGEYTVTLVTPQNTYAVVSDTINNAATPTDTTNVFTMEVNEEARGNLSRVYGAFELVERGYRLGVEIRGLDGRRTDDVTVWVQNENFTVFEGNYNEYGQWLTNAELPAGQYRITLDTPDNTYAVINPTTPQYAVPTEEENVFTIELSEANLGTSSAVYGAFQLEEMGFTLGVEVRGLNSRRTNDVDVTITSVENDEEVFSGSFNEYNQWLTDLDLPAGDYTIRLDTPRGTVAVLNETTAQYAVPTGEQNVFTITLNEENLGTSSAIYGAFQLIEAYPLGLEIRGLDNLRTTDVTVWVQDENFAVVEGSFNDYGQWHSDEALPIGTYTVTLDTPDNTYAVLNDTGINHAEATDEQNVFTIDVHGDVEGNLSRVYGAFQLEEMGFILGVEVRGLDGRRTDDVTVYVQDEDFTVFEGSFNDYTQWKTDEELPAGEYTITLVTPENTYAVINDTTVQYAVPTDRQNVFTIELNETNLGTSPAIYGAFQLVEMEYRLGVEVRGLDGRRTTDVDVRVANTDDEVFAGSYNEYAQWVTEQELPAGQYTITLNTPEGTVAVINETTSQYAVPTDEENVFTIELNETNQGTSSAIYGAFRLEEVPAPVETHPLGIEVRGLNGRRTNEVGIVVTDADGTVFEGSYDQWNLWTSTNELPVGTYTITLTAPQGTVAVVNETVATQAAEATDTPNVFTIDVNLENRGALSRVFGAFILVEVDEPVDPDPEEPVDPAPIDSETPEDDDNDTEDPTSPETPVEEQDEDEDDLPETGIAPSTIGLGITTLLSGLGLAFIEKKRRK